MSKNEKKQGMEQKKGLIDLNTVSKEEMQTEAIEMIKSITDIGMVRYVCGFLRAFYQRYDGVGYQIFLAEKNGEKNVSIDELLRRSVKEKSKAV